MSSWKEAAEHAGVHQEKVTQREKDLALIGRLRDHEDGPDGLTAYEANALDGIQARMAASTSRVLTPKERQWLVDIDDRVSEGEYENAWSEGKVPSGAGLARPGRVHHFETMARPAKPPGRA